MVEFNTSQRDRIIHDIINHESESRFISREEYSPDEIDNDVEQLKQLTDSELEDFWCGTVGEWLCSIGPEYPRFFDAWMSVEGEYDDPAEWQFEKLISASECDYGYQFPVYTESSV